MSKVKTVVMVLLAVTALAGTGLLSHRPLAGRDKPPRTEAPEEPLPAGAVLRLGTTHFRHPAAVQRVLFSRDGKTLVTATRDEITLWDVATARRKAGFPTVLGGRAASDISSFSLSADGRLLAVASHGRLHVWDVLTGKAVPGIPNPRNGVYAAAFTPDGKTLAVGCHDDILLWDLQAGREVRRFGATSWLTALCFSPDGKMLAASSRTPEVTLWDVATGKRLRRLRDTGKEFDFVTFSDDGASLAASGTYNTCVWETATGRIRLHIEGYRGTVGSVGLSADGKRLALGGSHGEKGIQLLDVATGKELRRFGERSIGPYNVALSSDGKLLAAGSWFDNRPHLWDVATGEELHADEGHRHPVRMVAFTPDGRSLLSGANEFRVWDVRTGKQLRRFGDYPWSLAVSSDGKTLATGDVKKIRLWDAATLKETGVLDGDGHSPCLSLAFSPDGKLLASAGNNDYHVFLWDVKARRVLFRLGPESVGFGHITSESVTFAPNGKTLAASSAGSIRAWDAATGKQLWEVSGSPNRLAFSPAGDGLAALIRSSTVSGVILYDPATGAELRRLAMREPRRMGFVLGLAFSPDGKTLATAAQDGLLRFWEVLTGAQRRQISAGANCLAFSPDGQLVAAGNRDSTVLLWDATGRRVNGRIPPATLSPAQLRDLWAALAADDAEAADRAIWAMVAGGRQSVPFLATRLRPAPPGDAAARARRIARLIAELDDDKFQTREKASAELARLGGAARPALQQALAANPSLEARRRIEPLLRQSKETRPSSDLLHDLRAIEVLEKLATPEARQLLEALAQGDATTRLTREARASLERLARRPAAVP